MENASMDIRIKLFASLRVKRLKAEVREYLPETSVAQVLRVLGIAEELVGIVLINGRHASLEVALQAGDTLALVPLVDGG